MSQPVEYIKPPEPAWSVADDLRQLLILLRAATMQAGTLHKRAKGQAGYRVNLLAETLSNHENALTSALVTLQNREQAEKYFDNEGALMWEVANEVRMKGSSNRQGSVGLAPAMLQEIAEGTATYCESIYRNLLDQGVAPESARMVLPLATTTTLYVTGNIRSWIHYFAQRCDAHAQKEHRELALLMRGILAEHFPVLTEALNS